MSYIKLYDSESFDILEALEESEALHILTSFDVENCDELFWSYGIFGETDEEFSLIKEETGWATICDCKECEKYGEELFEYYSILMALSAIKDKFPEFEYFLWVFSEKFIKEADENVFCRCGEFYKCSFLKMLGANLALVMPNVTVMYLGADTEDSLPLEF
jgi:hypothetical protein